MKNMSSKITKILEAVKGIQDEVKDEAQDAAPAPAAATQGGAEVSVLELLQAIVDGLQELIRLEQAEAEVDFGGDAEADAGDEAEPQGQAEANPGADEDDEAITPAK